MRTRAQSRNNAPPSLPPPPHPPSSPLPLRSLLTAGTTRYGARVHRGFWFLKLAVLIGLLASAVFVDNSAMAAYREVARVVSFFFLVLQILLLIDFGYRTNEWLVELDEASDYEGFCSWKIVLLVAAVVMCALSIPPLVTLPP